MQSHLYPNIATALTVALVVTLVFLGAARTWLQTTRGWQRKSRFASQILFQAGHRIRQEIGRVDSWYAVCLAGMLVFLLLFAAVLLLRPAPLPLQMPDWAWMVLGGLITVISLYLPYQALRLRRLRVRLADSHDAHVAVGHALQRVVTKGNRLFHNVVLAGQVIDNVVVGPNGAYAVNVFVCRATGSNKEPTARINGSHVEFGRAKDKRVIEQATKRVKQLSLALANLVGHKIPVQSVIAVPGWTVGSTDTNGHLLVNEQTVVTLTGWTRPDAYLMDEDVDKVCEHLTGLCRETPGKSRPRRGAPRSKQNKKKRSSS